MIIEKAVSGNHREVHSPLQTLSTNHVFFSVTLSHDNPVLNLTGYRTIDTKMACLGSRKLTSRARRAGWAHCNVPGQHLFTQKNIILSNSVGRRCSFFSLAIFLAMFGFDLPVKSGDHFL